LAAIEQAACRSPCSVPSPLPELACWPSGCFLLILPLSSSLQASNGEISSDPRSLHRPYDPARARPDESQWNEYQQAIIAVGEILAPYDK
jgi:hypothetical protein